MPDDHDRPAKRADSLRRWFLPIIGAGAVGLVTAVVAGVSPLHGQDSSVVQAAGSPSVSPTIALPSRTGDFTQSVAPSSQSSAPTVLVSGKVPEVSSTPKKGAIDPGTYARAPTVEVIPPPPPVQTPQPLKPGGGEISAANGGTQIKKLLRPSNGWNVSCGKIGYEVDAGSSNGVGAMRFAAHNSFGEGKVVFMYPAGTTRLTVVSATCQRFILKDDAGALFGYLPNASSVIPGG